MTKIVMQVTRKFQGRNDFLVIGRMLGEDVMSVKAICGGICVGAMEMILVIHEDFDQE